jgi:hypothetical protein
MLDWAPLLDFSDVTTVWLLPILLHCRDDHRASAARTGKERRRHQGISAQRPRYPSGGRGPPPILDADPLRSRELITAHVGAHTGYTKSHRG